jgi:hypothetical protein
MSVRSLRLAAALLGLVVAASVLSACGSSSVSPEPSSSAGLLATGAELPDIVFHQSDATNDFIVKTTSTSTAPTQPPSLEMCGYKFSTEADRIARERTYVYTQAHLAPTGVSSEAVAYKTIADAQLAMNQFRDALLSCKKGSVHPSTLLSDTSMPLSFEVLNKDTKDTQFPLTDNVGAYVTVTDQAGKSTAFLFIYQRFQNAIVGIVTSRVNTKTVPTDAITLALSTAQLVGARMSAVVSQNIVSESPSPSP